MTKDPKFINANRRRFVQSSAIVGTVAVSGAGIVDAATSQVDASDQLQASTPKHAGYQLTDRVKEYYRKARF